MELRLVFFIFFRGWHCKNWSIRFWYFYYNKSWERRITSRICR